MIIRTILAVAAMALAVPAAAQDAPPSYTDVSQATAPVADAYFAAYIGRDWDVLETLLVDGSSFEDSTASHVFGPVLSEGREAMMERFRVGYAGIAHMEFVAGNRMISGENAIFQGALHWGIDIGNGTVVDSVTPMVIVLTVEDGKVVRHEDYVDYAPFLEAVAAAQAG